MATREAEHPTQEQEVFFGDEVSLKQALLRYHGVVHTLAMHLTSNEDAAERVAIEVFTRLGREHHRYSSEPLDSVIHRFTYDAALPVLLEQITKHTDEVDAFGLQFAGPENSLVC